MTSTEHRVWPELTLRVPIGKGVSLVDRLRNEFRDINQHVSWRYRNRLLLEKPLHIGDRRITPFIAGEVFYDTRYHGWTRTLYLAGARIPLVSHVSVDAQYLRVLDTRARPGFCMCCG